MGTSCGILPHRDARDRAGLVPQEGDACLGGEVNERLAADIDRRAQDRAAGEGPRRLAWIVASDRLSAVFPYGEPPMAEYPTSSRTMYSTLGVPSGAIG